VFAWGMVALRAPVKGAATRGGWNGFLTCRFGVGDPIAAMYWFSKCQHDGLMN